MPDAYTLAEISEQIERLILVNTLGTSELGVPAQAGFPLSNPVIQSARLSKNKLSGQINWNMLLTGHGITGLDEDPPKLSLQKSEQVSGAAQQLAEQEGALETRFDVDSVTFEAKTLAIHRTAFHLFQCPNFLQTIQQDQKIAMPGWRSPMHKTKHIALGYGVFSSGCSFTTYLFFPNYPYQKGRRYENQVAHLDNRSLEQLFDQAIYPAMREEIKTNITQHHPTSFADARTKAHVKGETGYSGGNATGISLANAIAEDDLDRLWKNIEARCSNIQGVYNGQGAVFSKPQLIIQAHDLKLKGSRSCSLQHTYKAFNEMMHTMFYMERADYVDKRCYWVDLAREVTPSSLGYTLLLKPGCLKERVKDNLQRLGQMPNAATFYPMGGTSDAGALTIKLSSKSTLCNGGILDVKVYNVNKEQLAVPIKGHIPWAKRVLEGLGLTIARLQEWYQKGTGRNCSEHVSLDRLVLMYQATKQRVWSALASSTKANSSYGVREEYRITFELFEAYHNHTTLDLETVAGSATEEVNRDNTATLGASASTPTADTHLPFWVLPTADVNRFRVADMNRWLTCLESIMAVTTKHVPGLKASSMLDIDKDLHSPLTSTMFRFLHASLGCQTSDRSIWQGLPRKQRKRRQREDQVGREESNKLKEGLNMKQVVKKYGMMWLPTYSASGHKLLSEQTNPPQIQPSLREKLAVGDSGLSTLFKQKHLTLTATFGLDFQLQALGQYIDQLVKSGSDINNIATRQKIYKTVTEACVREYNKWMWTTLRQRWEDHIRVISGKPHLLFNHSDFGSLVVDMGGSQEWLSGLVCLGYGQITSIFTTTAALRLVPLQSRAVKSARFPQHTSGLWKDRVQSLFLWEPNQFHNAQDLSYRTLFVGCQQIIQHRLGDCIRRNKVTNSEFEDFFISWASRLMFVALHYDYDSPAKLAPTNSINGRATVLSRTQLICATVDPIMLDTQDHNAWLQKKARKKELRRAINVPEHNHFLNSLWKCQDLRAYALVKKEKGKKGRKEQTTNKDCIPFAHGQYLKYAQQLENMGTELWEEYLMPNQVDSYSDTESEA